jgi:outer membrane protein assembly factor BamD (BamD/ComL family)
LLISLGVVILAAAVVGGVFYVDHQAAQKAQDLEREAMRFLTAPSASDPQKADQALKEAIAKYRQIVDQYPRTATAPLALYHLGNTLVQANDQSGAIEAYQRFLASYSSNLSMAGLVQQRLAYLYLLKGDRDQAVKALTGILETPGTLNRDQALYELARLEESQSRPEAALARYQELIKTYPNSPFTSEATIRTKIMDVKKSQDSTTASTPTAPSSAPVQNTPSTPPSSPDKKNP